MSFTFGNPDRNEEVADLGGHSELDRLLDEATVKFEVRAYGGAFYDIVGTYKNMEEATGGVAVYMADYYNRTSEGDDDVLEWIIAVPICDGEEVCEMSTEWMLDYEDWTADRHPHDVIRYHYDL